MTAILDFVYDESGRPFALRYSTNGGRSFKTYYYILNLQGDVVKLVWYIPGFEYEEVAEYTYDAWGNILSATGDMAEINPLRYRGYYYDSETGFYYLQSRYYDPVNRRFINADVFTSTGQGILGTNMFAYCNNVPVMSVDYTGYMMAEFGNQKNRALTFQSAAPSGIGGGVLIVPVSFDLFDKIGDWIKESRKSKKKAKQGDATPPDVTAPEDPSTPPEDGYEWRPKGSKPGTDKGAWLKPKTGEQWHPDLNHGPPKGPHWDYTDPNRYIWEVYPDGTVK